MQARTLIFTVQRNLLGVGAHVGVAGMPSQKACIQCPLLSFQIYTFLVIFICNTEAPLQNHDLHNMCVATINHSIATFAVTFHV